MPGGIGRRTVLLAGLGAAAVPVVAGGCGGGESPRRTVEAAPNTFLIRGARIFDGERVADADSVLVERGVVTAVGRNLPEPADGAVHDGTGRTVLPGLIDSHTHHAPTSGEGLKFGVTTTVDLFCPPERLAGFRRQRESLDPATEPDVWSAGVLATVPGGHGTQYGLQIPTLDRGSDPDAFVADRLAEGSDLVKIVFEDGSVFGRQLNTLTAEQVAGLVDAAHRRDVLAAVHVSSAAGATIATAAGTDVLAHVPADPVDAALVDNILAAGTAVVATMVVMAGSSCSGRGPALRDDPRIAPQLIESERQRLGQEGVRQCLPAHLDSALANVAALHAAGVPVLVGSDSPNPATAFGASVHGELELLVLAGLSPTEALTAATALPARRFRLIDRGRVAAGSRGDLVLVDGDPTADVTKTRAIVMAWKNGYPVDRA